MNTILKLPPKTQAVIDAYKGLDFGDGKLVVCPYFINKARQRASVPVLVGKGSPQEIVEEAKIKAKIKGVDLDSMSTEQIGDFLRKYGLGVDCSGFLAHVLRIFVKEKTGKSLFRVLKSKNGFLFRILFKLHPVKNISVEVLASDRNSSVIENVDEILPGDMIVTKNGKHILLVSEVEASTEQRKITYWQSKEDGEVMSKGVVVTEPQSSISKQLWESASDDMLGNIEVRRLNIIL